MKVRLLAALIISLTAVNVSFQTAQANEGITRFHFPVNARPQAAMPRTLAQSSISKPIVKRCETKSSTIFAGEWVKGRLVNRQRVVKLPINTSTPVNRSFDGTGKQTGCQRGTLLIPNETARLLY